MKAGKGFLIILSLSLLLFGISYGIDYIKTQSNSEAEENNTGIQVYIGNETPVKTMKDCSVVTATYELEEGMKGTIGIIGPRRMDYDKVISTLKTLKSQLDTIYKKDNKDET